MALPEDVTTITLRVGHPVNGYTDPTGAVSLLGAKGKFFTVDPLTDKRINVTHVASGQTILPTPVTVTLDEGGKAKATLDPVPHTDNPGLSPVGFAYRIEWDLPSGSRHASPGNKTFALPTAAGATADFDLLDVAEAVPGVLVPTHGVPAGGTSGQVLAKASADDFDTTWVAQTGGGGASAPEGALAVFATEDPAVADAHPEYVWLILEPTAAPGDTTAPSVPTGLTATPGDAQVALSWTASTDAVGVTGYRVYRGGTLIASPTGTTYTDTGRTNGTQYSYTVAAADAAGNVSAQSAAVTATPASGATVPGQVTALTATPGNAQVALSWTAPASNGGSAITDYKVEYRTGAAAFVVFADGTSTTTAATVTGLTNGTAYDFRVSAVNAIGAGAASATTSSTPTAPTGGVAIATDDFTGTDGNLAGRTTTTGGKVWTKNFGNSAGINANRAALVGADGASRVVATFDAGTPDVDVTAINGTTLGSQAGGETGVVVRCTAGATPTYVQLSAYDTGYRLFYMDQAAVTTTPLVPAFAPAPAPGDVMRLKAQGTTYTAYINGTQVAQVTSELADESATGVGITGKGASFEVFLDDFAVVSA